MVDYITSLQRTTQYTLGKVEYDLAHVNEIVEQDVALILAQVPDLSQEARERIIQKHIKDLAVVKKAGLLTAKRRLEDINFNLGEAEALLS